MVSDADNDLSLEDARVLLMQNGASVLEIVHDFFLVRLDDAKFEMSEYEVPIFAAGLVQGLKLAGIGRK